MGVVHERRAIHFVAQQVYKATQLFSFWLSRGNGDLMGVGGEISNDYKRRKYNSAPKPTVGVDNSNSLVNSFFHPMIPSHQ